MKPWEAFFPDVLPSIEPGLPEPMVVRQLLRAAQQFCQRTRAWRVELDLVLTVDGQKAYDIELPQASELVRIEGATLAGNPVTVWRQEAGACGQYVFTPDGKQVLFKMAPGAGADLVLDVTLKPSHQAVGVEDEIFDRYSDLIASEAIARLNGDMVRHEQFVDDCAGVRADLWRGMSAIAPRARASWF